MWVFKYPILLIFTPFDKISSKDNLLNYKCLLKLIVKVTKKCKMIKKIIKP